MQEPILTFKHYCAKTDTLTDICQLRLQYFRPEAITELWDYEVDHKGDWKRAFKCGEINSREYTNKVLFGVNGYVYSFVKVYANSQKHNGFDHFVASFSGYGDCTGSTYVMDLAQYTKNSNHQDNTIIDDYDLLMQKLKQLVL